VLVWLNGRVVAAARARVPALDRGLLHGDGAYDTWRTYAGRPFAVDAHIRRLAAATRALALPAPGSAPTWAARSRLLARRNGLADAAVRLTITRGDAGDALAPHRSARPTRLLTVRPLPPDLAQRQAHGVAVVLLPFPRDVGPPWGRLKLIGHASAVAGRTLAARRKADEGLYVTAHGEVTEATTANVFIVERDGIVTPPLETGILPGVTRALVLKLARRAGLAVHEEPITASRLKDAAEVFLTASTVEVLPVVRIDTHRQASGKPGPITRLLQDAYTAHVRTTLRRA
jgi:branched-subunit amino acid aminotransferase/4-amino-4-deoxychorismate lyase